MVVTLVPLILGKMVNNNCIIDGYYGFRIGLTIYISVLKHRITKLRGGQGRRLGDGRQFTNGLSERLEELSGAGLQRIGGTLSRLAARSTEMLATEAAAGQAILNIFI